MHIETHAGALLKALELAGMACERHARIPILAAVLFEGDQVTGTNLDLRIRASFAATRAEGRAALLRAPLLRLLKCLPGETEISLVSDGDGARLRYPQGECLMPAFAAEDFPDELFGHLQPSCVLEEGKSLLDAMALALPFVSTEETRYYLNGVHLAQVEGAVHAVATDGHRMMVAPSDVDGFALPKNIIVPTAAVRAMVRMGALMRLEFANLNASDARSVLRFRATAPGVQISGKLIDGTYPNYQRLVSRPEPSTRTMTFDRLALAGALRRVMAMAVNHRPAAAVLSVSGMQAAVSQRAADVQGGVRELLEMEACTGDRGAASIHLNGRYLMQMLNALKGSVSVTIDVASAGAPLLLTGDDTRALSLLMPMRADDINTAFARDGFNQLRCQPLKAVA